MITRNLLKTVPVIIFLFVALTSCKEGKLKSNDAIFPDKSQTKSVTTNKDSLILTLTKQILTSLKDKNFKNFSEFIHPATGVRFSSYAYIDTTSDVKLTANELLDLIKKQNKLEWGSFDGSGEPILLTVTEYFGKFVYNVDFLNAEKRSVNAMIGSGNSLNNLESIYKDCYYTESYFSGFDKKYEGMDWCCLRLVFKNYNDKYYLVGIVHDQWTI